MTGPASTTVPDGRAWPRRLYAPSIWKSLAASLAARLLPRAGDDALIPGGR